MNEQIRAESEHNRTYDGLAQCLRDAADAVEKSGDSRLVKILLTANGVKG